MPKIFFLRLENHQMIRLRPGWLERYLRGLLTITTHPGLGFLHYVYSEQYKFRETGGAESLHDNALASGQESQT